MHVRENAFLVWVFDLIRFDVMIDREWDEWIDGNELELYSCGMRFSKSNVTILYL